MNSFDVVTIILTVIFGGIGGAWLYTNDDEIGSGIAGFILFGLVTFVIMFFISIFGAICAHEIKETTEIPIIIEKINKDDLSIIVKEKDERYIVDSKKYFLIKGNKSYNEVTKTELKSNIIFNFMKYHYEDQCVYVSLKEFKEFTK